MTGKINIAIADDHILFREGLISLFQTFPDLKLLFEAQNGLEVMEKLKLHVPDVVLLDLDMDGMNGEEAFDAIKQKYPETRVIILTGHFNDSFVVRFIKKQVPCVLSKATPVKTIVEAIRTVHKTGYYFNDTVSSIMAKAIADSASDPEIRLRPESNLNFQEIQVLKLMCLGYSTRQIAEKVHRAERTIDYNRSCIWHKTEIKNNSIPELILFALRHKILAIM